MNGRREMAQHITWNMPNLPIYACLAWLSSNICAFSISASDVADADAVIETSYLEQKYGKSECLGLGWIWIEGRCWKIDSVSRGWASMHNRRDYFWATEYGNIVSLLFQHFRNKNQLFLIIFKDLILCGELFKPYWASHYFFLLDISLSHL